MLGQVPHPVLTERQVLEDRQSRRVRQAVEQRRGDGEVRGYGEVRADGRPVGAISVSGPDFRIRDHFERFGLRVRDAAIAIARELGAAAEPDATDVPQTPVAGRARAHAPEPAAALRRGDVAW